MASSFNRWALILVAAFTAGTSWATTYPKVNMQFSDSQYYTYTTGDGFARLNVYRTVNVTRPAGEDPTLTIDLYLKSWSDGTTANNLLWLNMYINMKSDSFNTTNWDIGPVDLRTTPYEWYYSVQKMPGTYSWVTSGKIYNGVNPTPWTLSIPVTEALLTDNTPPGGGGGEPGTGMTDTDKSWIEGLWTLSDGKKTEWEAFKNRWNNMGPWGQLNTAKGHLAQDGSRGDQPYAVGVSGAGLTLAPGVSTGPIKFIDWDNETVAAGGASDGYSPWVGTSTVKGWKTVLRGILAWALYAMCLMAFISYLKGRIQV